MKTSNTSFDIYQPFVISAISVIKEVAGIRLSKKNLFTQYGKVSSGGTAVGITVVGEIQGLVIYEFSRDFTMRISSRMLKDNQILTSTSEEYQKLLESMLKEIANIISGNVISLMQTAYPNLNIEPPIVFLGKGIPLFDSTKKVVIIELTSPYGDFDININLKKRVEADNVR